jgi:hypothetical protein
MKKVKVKWMQVKNFKLNSPAIDLLHKKRKFFVSILINGSKICSMKFHKYFSTKTFSMLNWANLQAWL